jgi:site-specific DNA-methyltransferase (adenine-specific)
MIPERFAFKMIEHGWILRNKIIWHKPNAMPSSAKDRFTIDYEFIYFFVKSQKYYFETQYEPFLTSGNHKPMPPIGGVKHLTNGNAIYSGNRPSWDYKGRIKRSIWPINTEPYPEAHFAVFPEELVTNCLKPGCPPQGIILDPFLGSGTTAMVALKNNRRFIGIELNPEYMAQRRTKPYLRQTKLDACLKN